jgi:hypothetical protein
VIELPEVRAETDSMREGSVVASGASA